MARKKDRFTSAIQLGIIWRAGHWLFERAKAGNARAAAALIQAACLLARLVEALGDVQPDLVRAAVARRDDFPARDVRNRQEKAKLRAMVDALEHGSRWKYLRGPDGTRLGDTEDDKGFYNLFLFLDAMRRFAPSGDSKLAAIEAPVRRLEQITQANARRWAKVIFGYHAALAQAFGGGAIPAHIVKLARVDAKWLKEKKLRRKRWEQHKFPNQDKFSNEANNRRREKLAEIDSQPVPLALVRNGFVDRMTAWLQRRATKN